ncbi:MAG TPA: FAD:protein FMN transferase [Steroidobacteraceae bacterium]|jgi:thiamine biosynthesis lipoprotein|nr:FAD:protein FMN transferase [Steroidobacteraceae bacterium]
MVPLSRLRVGFGSFVAIEAQATAPGEAGRALTAAFESLALVERLMHPTRAGSDLAALNACVPGVAIAMHPWTWGALQISARIHCLTGGAFEPCLPSALGRMTDLHFGSSSQVMTRRPVQVDLGGIAKGFAVDRAVDALRRGGCSSGLVNAGGDLRVFGSDLRQIICQDAVGRPQTVALRNHAIASSGVASPGRPSEHQGYYDGVRRQPILEGSVTVLARRAVIADALTKCLLTGDTRREAELFARFGACRLQLESQTDAEIHT